MSCLVLSVFSHTSSHSEQTHIYSMHTQDYAYYLIKYISRHKINNRPFRVQYKVEWHMNFNGLCVTATKTDQYKSMVVYDWRGIGYGR